MLKSQSQKVISRKILEVENSLFFPLKQLTVCKYHDFPIPQILREINFGESSHPKY